MKKLTVALLLLAGPSFAYEIEGNPDRKLSVGVEYVGTYLKGDVGTMTLPASPRYDTKEDTHDFMADIRVPVNAALTLNAGIGYATKKIEGWDADGYLYPINNDLKGPRLKVGARFYF